MAESGTTRADSVARAWLSGRASTRSHGHCRLCLLDGENSRVVSNDFALQLLRLAGLWAGVQTGESLMGSLCLLASARLPASAPVLMHCATLRDWKTMPRHNCGGIGCQSPEQHTERVGGCQAIDARHADRKDCFGQFSRPPMFAALRGWDSVGRRG